MGHEGVGNQRFWSLTAKMWTQALLSTKLAQSHYCYGSPGLTGSSPQREELVPLPDRFPIWSDLEVSALLPCPPGSTSPFPSSQANLQLGGGISSGHPHCLLCCHPACLSFNCCTFSCPTVRYRVIVGVKIHRLHWLKPGEIPCKNLQ